MSTTANTSINQQQHHHQQSSMGGNSGVSSTGGGPKSSGPQPNSAPNTRWSNTGKGSAGNTPLPPPPTGGNQQGLPSNMPPYHYQGGGYYPPTGAGYMIEEMGMPPQFIPQGYGFMMSPYMAYAGPASQPPPQPPMMPAYGYQMVQGMGQPGYYVPVQGMPPPYGGIPPQEYAMMPPPPPPPQHQQGGYPGMYGGGSGPQYGSPMDSGGPMSAPPLPRPGSGPQPPHSGGTISGGGNVSDSASGGAMGAEEHHHQLHHPTNDDIQQHQRPRTASTSHMPPQSSASSGGGPSSSHGGMGMGSGARPYPPPPPQREGSAVSVPGGRPRKPLTIIDPSTGQEVKLVDHPTTSDKQQQQSRAAAAAAPPPPSGQAAKRQEEGRESSESPGKSSVGETRPTTAATTGRPSSRQPAPPSFAAVAAGVAPTSGSSTPEGASEGAQPRAPLPSPSLSSVSAANHHDDYKGINDKKKLLNAALRKPVAAKPPLIDSKHPKQQQTATAVQRPAPAAAAKEEESQDTRASEMAKVNGEAFEEHQDLSAAAQQGLPQQGLLPPGGAPAMMYPMGPGMPPYGGMPPPYGAPYMGPQFAAGPMYGQPPPPPAMMMPAFPQPGMEPRHDEDQAAAAPSSEPALPQQPLGSGELTSSSAAPQTSAKSAPHYGGKKLALNKAITKKAPPPTVAVTSPGDKEASTAPTSGTAAAANEPAPHTEGPNHLGETSAVTLERKKLFSRAIGKAKPAPPSPVQQPSEPVVQRSPVEEETKPEEAQASKPAEPVAAAAPSVVSLAKKRGFKNVAIDRSAVHPSPAVVPQQPEPAVEVEQQQHSVTEELPAPAVVGTTPETDTTSKDKDTWEETSSSGEAPEAAGSEESVEQITIEPLPCDGPLSRSELLRMFLVAPATEAFRGDSRPIDFADEAPPAPLVSLSVASTSLVRQPGSGSAGGLRRQTSKGMMGQRQQGGGHQHISSGDWRKEMLGPQALREKYNRQQSRQQYKRSSAPVVPLKVTEHGYKVGSSLEEMSPQDKLHRQVMSNLNRITAENFMQVTASLAELDIDEGWKLELVVRTIFDKAIQESYYCEIYSDMCMQLRRVLPEFEGDDSSKPMTFTRALITKCQEEFEALPVDLDPTPEEREKANGDAQELEIIRSKKKERILGNMKFIGQLFLRQLLSVKVIKEVVSQLVFRSNEPEEHYIECVCILLQNIGSTLDQTERGRALCTTFLGRLREFKSLNYPSRLKFMIQDLIDNRARGWKDRQGNPVGGRSKNAVKAVTIQGQEDSKRQAKVEEAKRKMDELAIEKREQKEAKERELQEARAFKVDKFKNSRDYFHEDGDLNSFLKDVTEMVHNDPGCPYKMAENLVNWGAEDPRKAPKDAELLVELVRHGAVPFKTLNVVLRGFLEVMDEVAVDFPKAPEFYHRLFALLLTADYSVDGGPDEFDPQLVLCWKVLGSDDRSFDLAIKILEQVKHIAGVPGVEKALHDLKPLMRKMKQTDEAGLDKLLDQAGLLKDETDSLIDKLNSALKNKDFDAATRLVTEDAPGDLLGGKNALFERRVIATLISNLRAAWARDSWTSRLSPAGSLLRTVCGTGTETGVSSPNNRELHNQKQLVDSVANAVYDARLPVKDVVGVFQAFLDMGLLRQVVLQNWYSQASSDTGGQEARKFAAEGVKRVLAATRSSDGDTPPESSAGSVVSPSPSQ